MLTSILILLAGSGVFIAGMNMLSDGLQRSTGAEMKRLLGKISNNRLAGVGVGAAVTGLIQSSAATTVMVIGFVNAGAMTLLQAAPIIMGANIGTTVTGLLVSLQSLNISDYMAVLAFIGVMMTFFKKDIVKKIGAIICGLGLIFVGLDCMSGALSNPKINDFFQNLFTTIEFPLLLIIFGALFTALIQSSSAATGMIIMMVGTGAIEVSSALFIVLGSNIGTCVTAMIASIGTQVNARRTAVLHLLFNLIGTVVFTTFIWVCKDYVGGWLQKIPANQSMQIAWFHLIFNVTTTLLLLPFAKQLVKATELIVKDKPAQGEEERKLHFVDDHLLKTPAVAIMQVKKEVEYMATLAKMNLGKAVRSMFNEKEATQEEIYETEAVIDFTNKELTKYLIRLTPLVSNADENSIGTYFHVLNDVERIGDHAENFYEIGEQMRKDGLAFSADAKDDIMQMYEKVSLMFDIAVNAFDFIDQTHLGDLTAKENEVDAMKKKLTRAHVDRLSSGNCSTALSPFFFSTVSGLERVADHLVNVGYSIMNPTGSQSEAKGMLAE